MVVDEVLAEPGRVLAVRVAGTPLPVVAGLDGAAGVADEKHSVDVQTGGNMKRYVNMQTGCFIEQEMLKLARNG